MTRLTFDSSFSTSAVGAFHTANTVDMQKLLHLVEKTWMSVNAAQAAQARVKE
jgi:hypothetical protein